MRGGRRGGGWVERLGKIEPEGAIFDGIPAGNSKRKKKEHKVSDNNKP